MKLKITLSKSQFHNGPVTCVGWSSAEEVYSAGDDNQLLSWSVSTGLSTKLAQLADLYPTDFQFIPRAGGLGKHGDLILITSADGKFHILNKNGRIERTVEAHKGAILVGQWGNDGTGLLTAGEDGFIKIWSRSGMLRSTVVSGEFSVYGACWAPDNLSIAYTQGKFVVIKQLAPNTKPIRWKGHEGLVLCLAWSATCELLVSGGEDCKYRVWDSQGRQLFSSVLHDNHITSIAWSPGGDLFAVGSFNTLRLCDYSGWSRCLEAPLSGCIYHLSWSSDGTQLAAACANGKVLFAHVVERHVHYMQYTATVTEKKTVTVKNVMDDSVEYLELSERVIQVAMKYSHLVVTTPSQCYVYNTSNWNTPAIFELKDGSVTLLLLSEKHMLIVEKSTVNLYNFQGRLIATPRWPNMRVDSLKYSQISLSSDTLAVRDVADHKVVHIIDLSGTSGRSGTESITSIQHTMPILQVSLDQWGNVTSRNLAILDKTRDLYIAPVRSASKNFLKLGRKIESFQWNTEQNMIVAIQDAQLIVWYCPIAAFSPLLAKLCSFQYDSTELGRSPRISDFNGNSVAIRRGDGSLLNITISPFPALLHKYVDENKWNDALSLCRSSNDPVLWGCLAVFATKSNNDSVMDIAEEAYANIKHYEKVFYIKNMKNLPSKIQQKAAMALLGGSLQEADNILIHNGMVFNAIYNNVRLHNWTRALDLAVKHKTQVDTVLFLRKKYLEGLGKPENNNKFTTLNESVQIDDEKVKQKLEIELQKLKK